MPSAMAVKNRIRHHDAAGAMQRQLPSPREMHSRENTLII